MASHFDVRTVEEIIGYIFHNKTLLSLALTAPHRNSLEEGGMPTIEGNKRLTALGDVVLKLTMTQHWYHTEENNRVVLLLLARSWNRTDRE